MVVPAQGHRHMPGAGKPACPQKARPAARRHYFRQAASRKADQLRAGGDSAGADKWDSLAKIALTKLKDAMAHE